MLIKYQSNTKLDFGFYKGYEVGVVYVFDPKYIEWCIENINGFCIRDLPYLIQFNNINHNLDWQYKFDFHPCDLGDIEKYKSFKELINNADLGDEKYLFPQHIIDKNRENCQI